MAEEFDTWQDDNGPLDDTSEGSPAKETPEVEEKWTKTAALDERKKRQDGETRHASEMHAANERIARLEGANSARQKPAASDDDEFDYSSLHTEIPRVMKEFMDDAEKGRLTASETRRASRMALKISVSEEEAKEKYEDFDSIIPVWNAKVTKDPQLRARMLASADPAGYAYRWAKRQGSESEIEKLRKENAELKAAQESGEPPRQRPSNAKATGGGSKPGKKGLNPNSVLDDALDGR